MEDDLEFDGDGGEEDLVEDETDVAGPAKTDDSDD